MVGKKPVVSAYPLIKYLGDQGHVVRRQDTKQILAYIKFHIRKNLERLGAIYNAQWLIYLREQ